MAAYPTPVLEQKSAPANTIVQLYRVPSNVKLATVSVNVLNRTKSELNYTFWICPPGMSAPTDDNLVDFEHPINGSGKNIIAGISLGADYSLFLRANGTGFSVTVNGLAHTE